MKQRSWKTTSAGIGAILTALGVLFSSGKFDQASLSAAAIGVMTGLGLLFARDNDKSSEQVGATPGAQPANVRPFPDQE